MSGYAEMSKLSGDIAKDICKDEKVVKFVSGATSTLAGAAIGAATCNPVLGSVGGAAVNGLSRSNSQEVAEFATSIGVGVVLSAASVVATPIILVGLLFSLFDD